MIKTINKGIEYHISSFSKKEFFRLVFNSRNSQKEVIDGITLEDLYDVAIKVLTEKNKNNPNGANQLQIEMLERIKQIQKESVQEKIDAKRERSRLAHG